MKNLLIVIALHAAFLTCCLASASSVQVQCRGLGTSQDHFLYDVFFEAQIEDAGGQFKLNADGTGPGNLYDIGNRFDDLAYTAALEKDSRGRALKVAIQGPLLTNGRNVEVSLDVSRPQTKVILQFAREDGSSVAAALSCQTALAPFCYTTQKCSKHCHPMIGCEPVCREVSVCVPGKFASEG